MANDKPKPETVIANEPKPKKERKKRVKHDPKVPEIETFKDPLSRRQFEDVLVSSKKFVDTIKGASAIHLSHLKEVRKAVNVALIANFKTRRGDPIARKRARLEKAIAAAQSKLEELG